MSIFSNRIKRLREKRGWTKTYVAKMLHLPLTTYANYEYGSREPDIDTIKQISSLFNTTTDYLMGNTEKALGPNNDLNDTNIDDVLDNVESFDGKPMTPHDRDVIKAYLQGYFRNK